MKKIIFLVSVFTVYGFVSASDETFECLKKHTIAIVKSTYDLYPHYKTKDGEKKPLEKLGTKLRRKHTGKNIRENNALELKREIMHLLIHMDSIVENVSNQKNPEEDLSEKLKTAQTAKTDVLAYLHQIDPNEAKVTCEQLVLAKQHREKEFTDKDESKAQPVAKKAE